MQCWDKCFSGHAWILLLPIKYVGAPGDICQEVMAEFIKLETNLEDGANPIEKLEVVCSESQEGIVNLDIIPNREQDDFDAACGVGMGGAEMQQQQYCGGM